MMKTVNEVSILTGVSVRTLHHYDAIGLLKPAKVSENGYRLYDEASLCRHRNILMFRELLFPLKEIKAVLDNPDFDPEEALGEQIKLLEMQRAHIDGLISYARKIQKKGEITMDFNAFDKSKIEDYSEEVKKKWGETAAYKEYEKKEKRMGKESFDNTAKEMMRIFAKIGEMRNKKPSDAEVQQKIKELQDFITENYYTCTNEILSGLGEMYACDGRMKDNIDSCGGEGTAEFTRDAIRIYCR